VIDDVEVEPGILVQVALNGDGESATSWPWSETRTQELRVRNSPLALNLPRLDANAES
jgi:hypothetical protein